MNSPEWEKAECPICGREYSYSGKQRASTCGRSACLQHFFHPEMEKDTGVVLYQREQEIKKED